MLLRASTSESLFLSGPKGQAACSRGRSEAAKPQAKPPDGRSQDNAAPAGAAGGAAGGQASFLPPPSGRRPVNRRSGGCASLAPGYAPRAPLGRKRLSMDCSSIGAGYGLQKTVPCRCSRLRGIHPPTAFGTLMKKRTRRILPIFTSVSAMALPGPSSSSLVRPVRLVRVVRGKSLPEKTNPSLTYLDYSTQVWLRSAGSVLIRGN